MAVMDHTASSTVLSLRWSTATGLDLSASTVRHCLLKAGQMARMPLHQLLRAYIHQRHRGPVHSEMLWGAIGYNMRSRLLHIEGNLNSNCYIREVLQPEVLHLLQAPPHAIFQQGNAWPHGARIVQAFLLLSWPARSPDMSPIEHVWDMVGRRLIRHGPPEPTLDAL